MTTTIRRIKLGTHDYLVIDLTQPLHLDQEGYPGDPGLKRTLVSDIEHDGWHHYTHELGDHCFHPHCDAPNHFQSDQQERGMEIYDLEWCFHQACMIDLADSSDALEHNGIIFLSEVRKEHLVQFSGILSTTEALIIRTGYDRWIERNDPHQPELLPYLNRDAAEFIASFSNIRVVGIDSLTVDAYGQQVSHLALKHKMIVESLVHLYEIPERHRMNFTLQTSPVRIEGATGGPVVAYAYIELQSIM